MDFFLRRCGLGWVGVALLLAGWVADDGGSCWVWSGALLVLLWSTGADMVSWMLVLVALMVGLERCAYEHRSLQHILYVDSPSLADHAVC